jgi:hypothetical protein
MNRISILASVLIGMLGIAAPVHAAWPPAGNYLGYSQNPTREMRLVADGSGGLIVLWRYFDNNSLLHGRAIRVSTSGDFDDDWDGYLSTRQWWEASGISNVYPDGLGGAFFIYFSECCYPTSMWRLHHILPTGGIDPAWPPHSGGWPVNAGRAVAPILTQPEYHPWVQNDGTGGALVVFRSRNTSGSPGNSLLVRHVRSDGSLDPAWPAEGLEINGPGSLGNAAPSLEPPVRGLPDGEGGGVIVWKGDLVRAQRVTAGGEIAPGWPAGGLVLRDRPYLGTFQEFPLLALAASGSDHFFAAWIDDSTSGRRVWLQRFHRDGTIAAGWPTSAKLVHTYSNPIHARMIGDGSTGAYLGWGGDYEGVSGVRVLEDGSIGSFWDGGYTGPSHGVRSFDIANGASSGLIVVWGAGVSSEVRARWILANGLPDPNRPERVVTPAVDDLHLPTALSDGYGGVFVGWENVPMDWGHVMLNWAPYDSTLVDVPAPPLTRTIALRAWPNPARDQLEVQFTLATASQARLELLDLASRRIRSLDVEGAGPQVAKLANLRDVAPGVYLLRLGQGDAITTIRVALTH